MCACVSHREPQTKTQNTHTTKNHTHIHIYIHTRTTFPRGTCASTCTETVDMSTFRSGAPVLRKATTLRALTVNNSVHAWGGGYYYDGSGLGWRRVGLRGWWGWGVGVCVCVGGKRTTLRALTVMWMGLGWMWASRSGTHTIQTPNMHPTRETRILS